MRIAGIIAEYNPFHNGHAWQIAEAKRLGAEKVAVALSAGLVQRGELPLLPEAVRVRAALAAGADLVVALPAPCAAAGAEAFARAGAALLAAAGCDTLVFGAESADAAAVLRAAAAMESPEYTAALRAQLSGGARSFAAARQAALAAVCPGAETLVQNPNDNLGVEYARAIRALGLEGRLTPLALPRQGAGHHDRVPGGGAASSYASASALRALWARGGPEALAPYVPAAALAFYRQAQADGQDIDPAAFSTALLSRLRVQCGDAEPFAQVRGVREGLDHALEKAVRGAVSAGGLYDALTTVRYPRARMRRLALDAALGYTAALPALPPYLQILGVRQPVGFPLHGEADAALCARMGLAAPMGRSPSLAALSRRNEACVAVAAAQAAAVDLGALCRRTPAPMGLAFRTPCVFYTENATENAAGSMRSQR